MNNRKYRIQRDLVFLTVSMFVTVCIWIGFNIYDAYVTSTINETLQTQIIPIEGNFDAKTIQLLKNRSVIQPDFTELVATDESGLIPDIPVDEVTLTPTQAPTEFLSTDEDVTTEVTQPTPVEVAP